MQASRRQAADVRVPKRMEVEYTSTGVSVFQEVAGLTSLLFLRCSRLTDPCGSSVRQVLSQHFGREIRQQCRPNPLPSRLFLEPRFDRRDAGLRKRLDVLSAPLRVAGVYCNGRRVADKRK